jgi:hypothetical protein
MNDHLQLALDRLSALLGTVPDKAISQDRIITVGETILGEGSDALAASIDALFRIANDGGVARSVSETPHADHVRAAMRALRETLDDDEPEPTATIEAGRHRLYNEDGNEIGSGTDPLAALINALHRQIKRAQHRASKAEKINDAFRRALALLGEEA